MDVAIPKTANVDSDLCMLAGFGQLNEVQGLVEAGLAEPEAGALHLEGRDRERAPGGESEGHPRVAPTLGPEGNCSSCPSSNYVINCIDASCKKPIVVVRSLLCIVYSKCACILASL